MSDPPRLLDQATGTLTSRLLRAGVDEQPSDVVLRRTLAAAGTGIAIASTTTAAAAGSGATGVAPVTLLALAKWVGVGTLGGLVTITAATQLGAPRARSTDQGAPTHVEAAPTLQRGLKTETKGANIPVITADDTSATPSSPVMALREKASPDPRRANETSEPHDPPSLAAPVPTLVNPPAPLAEEVSFVDRGWASIRSREYARVLADLAVYERRFPNMSLLPEVLFLRMQAESELGNPDRAKAYARRILSAFPQSPQSARARDVLEGK